VLWNWRRTESELDDEIAFISPKRRTIEPPAD
jgi:hypothetical protein